MITAYLRSKSTLHSIFSSGRIPLARPDLVSCSLDWPVGVMRAVPCYMLSTRHCTWAQLDEMAKTMAAAGAGTVDEARAWLKHNEELPIREIHVAGVGIDLRAFL